MSTSAEPLTLSEMARYVDYLQHEWRLTELETDSIIELGACLAAERRDRATTLLHMEIRAEIMALVGCDLEEFAEGLGGYHA